MDPNEKNAAEALRAKEELAFLEPGQPLDFDPDEAQALGAFRENALSQDDL